MRISVSLRRTAAAALLFACAISGGAARAAEGERWRTTTEMTADWIPTKLPPTTVEVCAAKDWKQPPGGAGQNCQLSDVKATESKITWKQRCAGPPEMTGAGEITRTGDSYDGHLTMTSAQGTMKMKMSGRRTGTCDDPK